MSIAVRTLGWLLLLAAVGIMGRELYLLAASGKMKLLSWGEFWYSLHPASLNLYQAVVERYISQAFWDGVSGALAAPGCLPGLRGARRRAGRAAPCHQDRLAARRRLQARLSAPTRGPAEAAICRDCRAI